MKNSLFRVVLAVLLSMVSAASFAYGTKAAALAGCEAQRATFTGGNAPGSCPDTTYDATSGYYRAMTQPGYEVGRYWYTSGPCDSVAGQSVNREFFSARVDSLGNPVAGTTYTPPTIIAIGNCEYARSSDLSVAMQACYSYASNTSQAFCTFTYTATGASLTEADPVNGAPTSACQAGYAIGTVNGKSSCYPTGAGTGTGSKFVSTATAPTPGSTGNTGVPLTDPTVSVTPPPTEVTVSGGGGGGGTPAQVQQSLDNQTATNSKLDQLIAKPSGVDIPTDYNRETTQQQIKAGQCGGTGQPACKTEDQTAITDSDGAISAINGIKGTYDTLKNSVVGGDLSGSGITAFAPGTASGSDVPFSVSGSDTCTNPVVTMFSQSVTMPICGAVEPFKLIIAWFLSVLTAWYAWYRFNHPAGA